MWNALTEAWERNKALEAENNRLRDKLALYMNKNNSLWNAMAKLPGGLDAARQVGKQ